MYSAIFGAFKCNSVKVSVFGVSFYQAVALGWALWLEILLFVLPELLLVLKLRNTEYINRY